MTAQASEDISSNEITAALDAEGISYRTDVSGAKYTTFSIGGPVRLLLEPESEAVLQKTLALLSLLRLTPVMLGFGSNSIFPDEEMIRPVIKLGQGFRTLQFHEGNRCRVAGGASLMTLSRKAAALGLSGLEFAAGIPGSIGGAVRMNAGAHGGEMCDVLKSVTYVLPDGEKRVVQVHELTFDYRTTSIPDRAVIIEAELEFTPSTPDQTKKALRENLEYRKATQPLTLPSAGSTFRNPLDEKGTIVPAGKLLQDAGLKGERRGGALVSPLHANWIVNPERTATCSDVLQLIEHCQQVVRKVSGFELEPELVHFF